MKKLLPSIALFVSAFLTAQTATVIASGFTDLEGISADRNSKIYVSERSPGKIYNINNGVASEITDANSALNDFTISSHYDENGNYIPTILVGIADGGNLGVYNFNDQSFSYYGLQEEVLLYGGNNDISGGLNSFTDENSGHIIQFYGLPESFIPYDYGLSRPKDLAFDTYGNMYVANSGANELVKITLNEEKIVLASNIENINGVAVSNVNDVYFTSYSDTTGESKILKYSRTGLLSDYVTTNLDQPMNIVITRLGEMYVTNKGNGTVVKITDESLSNNDINLDKDFSLFPSITDDIIVISNPRSIDITAITIYNVNGALIKNVNRTEKTLDFTSVASGMYFVKIDSDKGSITKKMIKI